MAIRDDIDLPTVKNKPKKELRDFSILLYGEAKIGKTTLASRFPDALFFLFEDGAKSLSVYGKKITDWEQFILMLKKLKKDTRFANVIVDTIDIAYKRCFDYCCIKHGFEHPQDENDFGKSWGKIKDEFLRGINDLLMLDKGIIFISHATEKQIQSRTGKKYDRIVPSAPSQAREIVEGLVDCIFYYHHDQDKRRKLVVDGDDVILAGCRVKNTFIDSQTGEKLSEIPMGDSEEQGYKNLIDAFENRFSLVEPKKTQEPGKIKLRKA